MGTFEDLTVTALIFFLFTVVLLAAAYMYFKLGKIEKREDKS